MTFTSTQTTELSLDQLDDISAGFIGGAFKAAKASAFMAKRLAAQGCGIKGVLKNLPTIARTASNEVRSNGYTKTIAMIAKDFPVTPAQASALSNKINGIGAGIAGLSGLTAGGITWLKNR